MPEQRARKYHLERRGEALREEISTLIEGELTDPRIRPINVTEVHLAEDGKSAFVFVAVAGTDNELESALEGLEAAKGYIRHELISRLGLRHAPELHFQLDKSQKYGARIEELLARMRKRQRKSETR